MTKKKQGIDWRIVVAAIGGLTIIECFALLSGINGKLFALITGMIGALAGWNFPQLKVK